jgi:hypothetical protein
MIAHSRQMVPCGPLLDVLEVRHALLCHQSHPLILCDCAQPMRSGGNAAGGQQMTNESLEVGRDRENGDLRVVRQDNGEAVKVSGDPH